MSGRSALVASVALAALACAHAGPRPASPSGPDLPASEIGLASFYGPSLEGRPTASGATYDGRRLTCAHRSHPFGTVLRVTALTSGRSVQVVVTDRGPFAEGRVVDLSLAAARALGILEAGLARVRVEKVRGPDPPD